MKNCSLFPVVICFFYFLSFDIHAQDKKTVQHLEITEKVLSSLRIDGMNSTLEDSAKAKIYCSSSGEYAIAFEGLKDSPNTYGIVVLEKYAGNQREESKVVRGISEENYNSIKELMDKAIKEQKVKSWILLRFRSSGREFVGFYNGGSLVP